MKYSLFLVLVLWGTGVSVSVTAQPRPRRHRSGIVTNPNVHDPVMAKEGDTYYLYHTGWNISCLSSTDLEHWRFEPSVFQHSPVWALQSVPGYRGHTWAPDIVYHNGKYHLFYSCSSFGKNTSAIGHAERSTLNPVDTLNPWHDTGAVVRSKEGETDYNAIDPSVVIDKKGTPWMAFGSFWGGIQLIRLTDDLTSQDVSYPVRTIARRKEGKAIEAPFIYRHNKYYYLFVSFDYCCRGSQSTYKVAVGRSKKVEGPYKDCDGVDLAAGGGTVILSSDADFVAAGHCAAYTFDGRDYFLAHGYSREENGESRLILRPITWDAKDWPIVEKP